MDISDVSIKYMLINYKGREYGRFLMPPKTTNMNPNKVFGEDLHPQDCVHFIVYSS
jgi:hypothetical protein